MNEIDVSDIRELQGRAEAARSEIELKVDF